MFVGVCVVRLLTPELPAAEMLLVVEGGFGGHSFKAGS